MSETVTERGPCTECGTPHDACVGPDYCCDECLHIDANWDGYEQPEPARPVGGDTREALREADDLADPIARIVDKYLRAAGEPGDYAWYIAQEAAREIRALDGDR